MKTTVASVPLFVVVLLIAIAVTLSLLHHPGIKQEVKKQTSDADGSLLDNRFRWDEETRMAPWHAMIFKSNDAKGGISMHGTLIGHELVLTNNNNIPSEKDPEAKKFTLKVYLGGHKPSKRSSEPPFYEVEKYFVRPRSAERHRSIKQIVLMILKNAVDFKMHPNIKPVILSTTIHPVKYGEILGVPFQKNNIGNQKFTYVNGERKAADAHVPRLIEQKLEGELGFMDITGQIEHTFTIAIGAGLVDKQPEVQSVLVGIVDQFSFKDDQGKHFEGYYFLDVTYPDVRAWIAEKAGGKYIYH